MKKTLLASAFLLLAFISKSQYCAHDYDDELFQRFLGAKVTYVEKSGNAAFDSVLESAMAKYWTVSKYKLLSSKKIENEYSDPEVALLLPLQFEVSYSGGGTFYKYGVQALIMGGSTKLNSSDIIAFAHSDYKSLTSGDAPAYSFLTTQIEQPEKISGLQLRLTDIIKGINDAVELVKTNKPKFRPGIMNGIEYMNKHFYNKEIDVLKNKTLCVFFSNVNDMTKIKKAYPYKIEFMGREDFYDVIAGKRKDAVYLVMTNTYSTDALIITDPITHKCVGGLPFGFVTTIDAGDFRDIVKAIDSASK